MHVTFLSSGCKRKEKKLVLDSQHFDKTFGIGVSAILGCMPTDVVFANTISVVGRKVLSCSKDKASAPTTSASSFALSEFTEKNKTQKRESRPRSMFDAKNFQTLCVYGRPKTSKVL